MWVGAQNTTTVVVDDIFKEGRDWGEMMGVALRKGNLKKWLNEEWWVLVCW